MKWSLLRTWTLKTWRRNAKTSNDAASRTLDKLNHCRGRFTTSQFREEKNPGLESSSEYRQSAMLLHSGTVQIRNSISYRNPQ